MFRAAIIGCGQIGSTFADDPLVDGIYSHAGAYDRCAATDLVAVCDVDAGAADRCAARWNVAQSFTSLSGLLDETAPELVSICSPDATHAEVLERVLECRHVRGILAEKPLALNLADAERLARRARDRGVALAVNYTRRHTLGHGTVQQRIASGELGEIQTVSGRYTKGVLHNGTHWFDLARWLVGDVTAVQAHHSTERRQGDPDLDVYLRFENGARAALLSCRSELFSIFEMDIVGTSGRFVMYDSGHRLQRWDVQNSSRYSGYRALVRVEETESDMRDSILHAVEDLVQCVETGRRPQCDGDDAVSALRIGTLAVQSALEGREIAVQQTV
jgi:predicted dehydrogenase